MNSFPATSNEGIVKKKTTVAPMGPPIEKAPGPQLDNLALCCAAGAIAALGPERVNAILKISDVQLGRMVRHAITSLMTNAELRELSHER